MKHTSTLAVAETAPATNREHLLTVAFGLWMTVGLFLDGYFHQNLERDGESFLTPWHGVFYAGFAASAVWLMALSRRRAPNAVDWQLAHLPPGYSGARLGLVLFAIGGAGDAVWHTLYGVERGVDALLSPTHLLLFAGLVLMLTAPLRAAFVSASRPAPWMVAASLISAAALVGFFLNFAWGLGIAAFTRVPYDAITETGETEVIAGIASTLVTTVVLFGFARLLLNATRVPSGAITALFTVVALLVSVAFDEDAEGVAAALVAGVALELLLRLPARRSVAFGGAAGVIWFVYFGLLAALDGIEWPAEIWLGAVVFNALAAVAIAGFPSFEEHEHPSQEGAGP